MSAPRTARVRREERRAASASSLGRALDASDLSAREASSMIGVDEKLMRRWLDPHEGQSISVADLAALPEDVRVAVVRADLLPGYVVVRAPDGHDLGDDLEHALEMQRTASSVLSEQLSALADGHITAEEGARIEAAATAAMAATMRVAEVARRAQRERSIPARTLRAVGRK